MKKTIFVLAGVLFFFASCEKFNQSKSRNGELSEPEYWKRSNCSNNVLSDDPFSQKMSEEQAAYMKSLQEIDPAVLAAAIKGNHLDYTKTEIVWGLGSDRRVYRWNGSGWDEPNPAAGLDYVDVATAGGSIWGISSTHIYKWNGSSWSEPNPAAGLYSITAISSTMAFGYGSSGVPYVTTDGGLTWSYMGTTLNLYCLNSSDFSNKQYAVQGAPAVSTPRLLSYEYSTNLWTAVTTPSAPKWVDVGPGGGPIYYIENGANSQKIYKSTDGGVTFSQPNSAAFLAKIAVSGTSAWGIGNSNHVFRSTDGGVSWSEPSLTARLAFVSAGN